MAKRQEASTGKIVEDNQPKANSGAPTMHVKVYSPFQVYFDDAAQSLSAINETGPFDILPRHHNFITLLGAGELTIETGKQKHRLKIARGLMHVKADQVVVFLDV